MTDFWPHLATACGAYLLATASPGPSNMTIMATAMHHGRRAALTLTAGVICGSLTWGMLAAFGVSRALAGAAMALTALKIVGGAYLLFLAFRSGRSALRRGAAAAPDAPDARRLFLRGLALHLTNPKAILSWIAIVAIGLPAGASPSMAGVIVACCALVGVCVFGTYAIAFSTPTMARAYRRARRAIEATLALVFGAAGLRLLASST